MAKQYFKIKHMKTTKPNDSATVFGLTKREYFASLAMQSILTSGMQTDLVFVSHYSVEYADALIEALNESN